MYFCILLIVTLAKGAIAAFHFTTQSSGGEPFSGNVFEIAAKTKSIAVIGLSINIESGAGFIKIDARPGNVATGIDGWTVINTFHGVIGMGRNELTSLPDFDVPVVIHVGTKMGFYVTTGLDDAPGSIWCSMGSSIGSVYASNDDLEVAEGYSTESRNGDITWTYPRRWNGSIRYSVIDDHPTSSPTPTKASFDVIKVHNRTR